MRLDAWDPGTQQERRRMARQHRIDSLQPIALSNARATSRSRGWDSGKASLASGASTAPIPENRHPPTLEDSTRSRSLSLSVSPAPMPVRVAPAGYSTAFYTRPSKVPSPPGFLESRQLRAARRCDIARACRRPRPGGNVAGKNGSGRMGIVGIDRNLGGGMFEGSAEHGVGVCMHPREVRDWARVMVRHPQNLGSPSFRLAPGPPGARSLPPPPWLARPLIPA